MRLRISVPEDPYFGQITSIACTELHQEELNYLWEHGWIMLSVTKYGASVWKFKGVEK